jgi:cyanophycinase-like exopeptidase
MEAVMRPNRARRTRTAVLGVMSIALIAGSATSVVAAGPPPGILVPIGSDYQSDTLELFARQAAGRDTSGNVVILVIPITYSLNAYETKSGERNKNTTLAESRTQQVEDACNAVKAPTQTCDARLVPVLVRSDAYLASNLAYFTPDVDGMYVLGGDQTVAMQVVAGTPVEAAMADAYARGAVFGGNSAGDAVQSRNMINGYTGSNGPAESMRQGAVDVWTYSGAGDETRGLIFGMPDVIADQHVFEYGRTGRSLNVSLEHRAPVLGMDAATGGVLTDNTVLKDITGDTSAYVIDPATWKAGATWGGPNATLSARRVAMHLLPPGAYGFDFKAMRPVVGGAALPAPSLAGRTYPAFTTSAGAGRLLLSGGIADDPAGDVGSRFVSLAGGANARIVVLTAGYGRSTDAQAAAKAIAAALQPGVTATVQWFVLDGKTDAAAVATAVGSSSGIFLTAPDRSLVAGALAAQPVVVDAVKARWKAGMVLLADNAAAAVMGSKFIADPISPDVEVTAPADMLEGGVTVAPGLGWVANANVQPRLLPDQNWGQAIRLAAAQRAVPAVGIDVGTAIEVWNGAATARGASAAVVIDGRKATFGTGTNGSLAAAWMVIDSFVAGETLAP